MASRDTKKPVNNVDTSLFKLLIMQKKLGNRPQHVGEAT